MARDARETTLTVIAMTTSCLHFLFPVGFVGSGGQPGDDRGGGGTEDTHCTQKGQSIHRLCEVTRLNGSVCRGGGAGEGGGQPGDNGGGSGTEDTHCTQKGQSIHRLCEVTRLNGSVCTGGGGGGRGPEGDNQEMTEEEVGQRILTALKKVSPPTGFVRSLGLMGVCVRGGGGGGGG